MSDLNVRILMRVLALMATSGAASAHHSFAMFDMTQTLSLQGTVKEFQWTNPHCFIEDRERLTHPWQVALHFRRVSNLDRLIGTNCTENDRNPVVDGHVTIAPR